MRRGKGDCCSYAYLVWCFFFQAEDGIRDYKVTGVQTCALPILTASSTSSSCSNSSTSAVYVFQRRFGSTPSRITASRSSPGIGAWRNVFEGHSSLRDRKSVV